MVDKLFNAFPPETPQNIREDVISRFLTHVEHVGYLMINRDTRVAQTEVYHICDSVLGPLTIDEMIAKCRKMRSKYPKMNGTASPIIEDLEDAKRDTAIKIVILLDYEYEEKLNWIIMIFK